jgi:DNA anti-recombination protein RmuC
MLTWLAIKKVLNKTWAWLKHNWKAPLVLVYTLVLWVLFRRKDAAYKVLETRNQSYKDQIDAINKAHEEEIKKRNEILEQYNEAVKKLEKEFAKNNKELTEEKKKSVKEIVEKYYSDPDTLAKMIGKRFGFNYSEVE